MQAELEKLQEEIEKEEAEVAAAEAKEKAEADAAAAVGEPTPGEKKEEPPEAPTELDALKAELAEKDERIKALTRRLNAEDGRRGGELTTLRQRVEALTVQVQGLVSENAKLKEAKPAEPAQPARKFGDEFGDLGAAVDKVGDGLSAAQSAAERAKAEAEDAKRIAVDQTRRNFLRELTAKVPNWSALNENDDFLEFLAEQQPGDRTGVTRLDRLRECEDAFDVDGVAYQFETYTQHKAGKATVTPKPSVAGQVGPKKGAGSPAAEASGKPKYSRARMKQLHQRIFILKAATKDEADEYERLCDAEERGELGE